MKTIVFFNSIVLVSFFAACNQGLNPNSAVDEGFGGTLTFSSRLPPPDSLRDLRVVAIPYLPIDTTFSTVLYKITQGIISYSPAQITAADSGTTVPYEMLVKPATYYYIAVVQQYGSDVYTQWRVVSIYGYSPSSPEPKSITVEPDHFVKGINFTVDFYNIPPQPFTVQ